MTNDEDTGFKLGLGHLADETFILFDTRRSKLVRICFSQNTGILGGMLNARKDVRT